MTHQAVIALTREISPALGDCELTHLLRHPIDLARAADQHRAYEASLVEAGCRVERLPTLAAFADSVFIEDTAVVFDELAVVTRPGAPSRRAETALVAERLGQDRPIATITEPGTMDGGDVLVVGREVFVGRSTRTNEAAIDQLRQVLQPFGYLVKSVEVTGCLHLKSAVTAIAPDTLLLNPDWAPKDPFARFDRLTVDRREPYAANALWVGPTIIYPQSFPRTGERLDARGLTVRVVDVGELQKAEGAVTCCSLIFGRSPSSSVTP